MKPKHGDRAFGAEILVIRGNCQKLGGLSVQDLNHLLELETYIASVEGNDPIFQLSTSTKKIRSTWLQVIYRTYETYPLI